MVQRYTAPKRTLMNGSRIQRLSFPAEETHPGFDKLKKLASKVGKSFYQPEAHNAATAKLKAYMETLPYGQIPYYAQLVMLVQPNTHAMATGTGGFWAVASRVINEMATDILDTRRREWKEQYGRCPKFVVVD